MSELKIARGFALPLDLVTEATAVVATRGAGKSSASAVIVEEGFAAGVQSVIFDRTGVYWGLRSNARGDGPGLPIYVLGGPHGDVPLETHAGVMIADLVVDSGHSFVLDLSDFSKSAAIRFSADFLERLYDRKARSRSTTLLVMDEAHFYAPQTPRGGFKGDSARLMGAMEDVVGLGRSRGLGVVLTTQRTQALNKAVLDLIETLLVMRMLSPRARDAVQDWIREKHEDDREGVIATLESLPTGTAWVWSPLRGILRKVALRRIKTFDSYETPKPGQVRVEPSARKVLDLDALGEQMRATAERAKENDPAELRKRLREALGRVETLDSLQAERARELAASRGEVEQLRAALMARDEQPRVEVPVADEGKLESLAAAAQEMARLGFGLGELVGEIREALGKLPTRAEPVVVSTVREFKERYEPPGAAAWTSTGTVLPPAPANGAVTEPKQRILDAIAWFEEMRIPEPSRIQVGFVAGYKVSKKGGGTFAQYVADLTRDGLIGQPRVGVLVLTVEGRARTSDLGLPRTDEAMHAAVLSRLSEPEARILRVLLDLFPATITRVELGARTGYKVTEKGGGTFAQLLANLQKLGLVGYPVRGEVAALDVLFPSRR